MGRGIFKKIESLLGTLLDVLYPNPIKCSSCGRFLETMGSQVLCGSCFGGIVTCDEFNFVEFFIDNEEFKSCCNDVFSVCLYEGTGKRMVHLFKYKEKHEVAIAMARMMVLEIEKKNLKWDLITSVPLHDKRLKKRGYNQSEIIGRELSNILSVPYIECIERTKNTKSQVLFNGIERWYNIKDSFEVKADIDLVGKRVLLVDDVITTGATAYYASKVLKERLASYVALATFARRI